MTFDCAVLLENGRDRIKASLNIVKSNFRGVKSVNIFLEVV
jgi:hypothetical protein